MDIRPGWQTTEWWTTLLAFAAAVAVAVGHRAFADYIPAVAIVAAGSSVATYVYGRGTLKATVAAHPESLPPSATLLPQPATFGPLPAVSGAATSPTAPRRRPR